MMLISSEPIIIEDTIAIGRGEAIINIFSDLGYNFWEGYVEGVYHKDRKNMVDKNKCLSPENMEHLYQISALF